MAESNTNSNALSHNKKVKLIAGAIYDNVPYLKKAHSYIPQSELEGKKYGRHYSVYIPDPGKAVEGLEANPDAVEEIEVDVTLDNINTSCELDAWNTLSCIEDFTDEIALPRGRMLARSLEKKAIDQTVFKAAQAVVGQANLATLATAAGMLDEAGVAGNKVSFMKPTVGAEISAEALGKFIPSEIQSKIYKDKYLGQYAGAAQIEESLMPIVVGDDSTVSITFDAEGKASVGTGAKKGQAYKVDGLKIVDKNGIETDQDYIVVCPEDGVIPEIRVDGNRNAWGAAAGSTVTGTNILTSGQKYMIGQVRTESAVGFDSYKFNDLPGSETSTQKFEDITVKMSQFGDGYKMQALVRLDVPHAVCLPDQREAVVVYYEA